MLPVPGACFLEGLTGRSQSGMSLAESPSTGRMHLVVQYGRWLYSQTLMQVIGSRAKVQLGGHCIALRTLTTKS